MSTKSSAFKWLTPWADYMFLPDPSDENYAFVTNLDDEDRDLEDFIDTLELAGTAEEEELEDLTTFNDPEGYTTLRLHTSTIAMYVKFDVLHYLKGPSGQ